MTLTKTKPHRPTVRGQKRVAMHHKHDKRYIKAYWPYLPMVALLVLGLSFSSWLSHAHRSVLGYATDVSVQNIVDETNVQRAGNGEGALGTNAPLNQAAQAKANDMAARDYWSHNTPDGQTPWTFMTAAGYQYKTAGENLAYGFTTAAAMLDGWMNSPGHRANILNTTYTEMGVGIVNIPNYQNSGPQTLVVAMYGSPLTAPPVAAPAPVTPAPAPAAASTPTSAPAATPSPLATADTTPPTSAASPAPSSASKTAPRASTTLGAPKQAASEPKTQAVRRVQLLNSPQAVSFGVATTTFVVVSALTFVAVRHSFAWRKRLLKGERFVLHHPLLDIGAIFIITSGLVMLQTAGLIR